MGFNTDKIFKDKALSLFKDLYKILDISVTDSNQVFEASNGFIYKFRARHRISLKQYSRDSFNVNMQSFEEFIKDINDKISTYGSENVFNCDETGLFFKLAPSKSLASRERNGIKKYKDRVIVLLACNMLGTEKLKPLVIGKLENPRSFKNFNRDAFCKYYYNDSA
ncbi:Tigger transposable element-derived protein 6 [Dictyocoela muelleri]|nr:Tigger transposable element-derived protein 6 [Dictyocoela muelleri]